MIYYLWNLETNRVKIGYTTPSQIKNRMSNIKTANSSPLVLVACHSGTQERERTIHSKLRGFNVRGEWFDMSDQIVDHIDIHEDMEYFFDVFEEQLKQKEFDSFMFQRMQTAYLKNRMLVYADYPVNLYDWLDFMPHKCKDMSWRESVPEDIFEEPEQYVW